MHRNDRNHRNEPARVLGRSIQHAVTHFAEAERTGQADAVTTNTDTDVGLVDALGLLAKHVAFIHAGQRTGRNRVALDLVAADIDRVLAAAGMERRVDDRGDEWAELEGSPVMWLGHRAELGRSAVRP